MDLQFIREIFLATIDELKHYRNWFVAAFVTILLVFVLLAKSWSEQYVSTALIQADRKSIAADLLRNRAAFQDVIPANIARELFRSRLILTETAMTLGEINNSSSPEEINRSISQLSSAFTITTKANNLLRLEFSSTDPKFAHSGLSTLLDVFIENSSKEKQLDSQKTYQFIDSKVEEYRNKLEIADRKLSEFQSQNTDGTEQEVVSRISDLRSRLRTLSIDIDETNTKIRSIKRKLTEEQDYQKTKAELAILVDQRGELQGQLDQLRLRFKDAYQDIVSLKGQIKEIDDKVSRLQSTVPGSYSGENAREEVVLFDQLRRQLSESEVSLAGMQQRKESTEHLLQSEEARLRRIALRNADLTELTRDYNTMSGIYQDFLKQRESAGLSASIDREGQGMTYQIREHPVVPTAPSGLKPLHFVIAGPILSLLVPLGLLVLFVYFDPRIRSENRLKLQLPEGIELLATIPSYTSREASGALSKRDTLLLAMGTVALLAYCYTAYIWIIT